MSNTFFRENWEKGARVAATLTSETDWGLSAGYRRCPTTTTQAAPFRRSQLCSSLATSDSDKLNWVTKPGFVTFLSAASLHDYLYQAHLVEVRNRKGVLLSA